MRRHPHMYEINARILVGRVSALCHRELSLSAIPEEQWQLLRNRGFDLVWLMGAWQRSPGARQQALLHSALRREYDHSLPDWSEADVVGSPYAVYAYNLDPELGQPEELAQLRSRLNQQGMGLLLDFVPNHLALDHPWTLTHPGRFVHVSKADTCLHPEWFYSVDGTIYLAHGRDQYFPPWTDTVQVDFRSSDLRQALINELLQIAEMADGVRCDMAMLALNDVFDKVWGGVIKDRSQPKAEFWAEAIEQVKRQRPGFLFLAEAYWGLEKKLQEMGFDFTYDKSLYDRLRSSSPDEIRSHLTSDNLCPQRLVHFTENHDELRAIVAFGRERSLAAAVVLATVPGLRLFHDGQLEGRRIHLPIQLAREPKEADDPEIMRFYDRLLTICGAPAFHEGEWTLVKSRQAWDGNESHRSLLAWCWCYAKQVKLVVVDYSPHRAQGWLKLPMPLENAGRVLLQDELTGTIYIRDADELRTQGFYVDLSPWQAYILDIALDENRISV